MDSREPGYFSELVALQNHIIQKIHSAQGYSFEKARSRFKPSEDLLTSFDNTLYHRVTRIHKNKNNSAWIRIKNAAIDKTKHTHHARLTLTAGEIYRFEIGASQPKYRIVTENEEKNVISKEIVDSVDFYKYYKEHILESVEVDRTSAESPEGYHRKQFFEGTGRVAIAKLSYDEDDLHFGNAFLDRKKYFIGIDQDRTFWPISCKFFVLDQTKRYIAYRPLDSSIEYSEESLEGQKWYLLKGKSLDFIGEMTGEDYDNLPLIKYHIPSHWDFVRDYVEPYSKKLSQDKLFLNEKHFQSIKSVVTRFIKNFLVTLHAHEDNKNEVQQLIAVRLAKLAEICRASEHFKIYLAANKFNACKVIIYECHEFFLTNSHYRSNDAATHKRIMQSIANEIVRNYQQLLQDCNLPVLTESEVKQLEKFNDKFFKHEIAAYNEVAQFYLAQGMLLKAEHTLEAHTVHSAKLKVRSIFDNRHVLFSPPVAPRTFSAPASAAKLKEQLSTGVSSPK